MKIVTIVGARPQFIKSVPVSREFQKNKINEVLIHTGQHFDENMSDIFFDQMKILKPNYELNINNLKHGAMTGQMLERIEDILCTERPDYELVYGDTNSTLAGALAASKLNIKLIHVEAGLRSFNMKMPEEINRIITDRLSSYLFCPTDTAVNNLEREGFTSFDCKVIKSGDVMQDAANIFTQFARKPNVDIPDDFILCTIHRQENTDDEFKLKSILESLNFIAKDRQIILPIHPRTKNKLLQYNLNTSMNNNLILIEPVGYLEMLFLLNKCSLVITDSGGLQKEAFFFHKLCLTLRSETEWTELVQNGFNFICGSDFKSILENYTKIKNVSPDFSTNLYGNGTASKCIIESLNK